MKILAIANMKGGVGKTTTALNSGYALASMGRNVLLIDLDPQASLTHSTIGDSSGRSMAEVIGDTKPGRLKLPDIIQTLADRLDLAPADLALSNSELGLVARYNREHILERILAGVDARYDIALLDCGPSLGLLVVNALAAADGVITPTLPTALDLRGLALFLDSLETIRTEGINPGLELLGVLVTQYDSRLNLHKAAVEDMRAGGLPILPAMVGKSVKAAAAVGAGEAIDRGNLAEQYKQLAELIDQWLKT